MARYSDDEFGGRKKTESAHVYTLAANMNQNTYQQDIKGYQKDSHADRDYSDSDEDRKEDDEESDSLNSQTNIIDIEAD